MDAASPAARAMFFVFMGTKYPRERGRTQSNRVNSARLIGV